MFSCVFSTCAPILALFFALTAKFRRAQHASSCTFAFSAWRRIAVTTASIPPCVRVCLRLLVATFCYDYVNAAKDEKIHRDIEEL